MTRFDKFKNMNIDKVAEWIDEHGQHDDSSWMNWFDNKYCSKCKSVIIPKEETLEKLGFKLWHGDSCECSYCEVNKQCRYFPNRPNPSPKDIIKMWLESEVEE